MEPYQEEEPEKVTVVRRSSCDLAEVMRQRREVCNTWESAPDDCTANTSHRADLSEGGGATPTGAVSTSAQFHVASSPKVLRGSGDLRDLMRKRKEVCKEFESAPIDSTADTTALSEEAAVPGHVQKDMTTAESPATASPTAPAFRGRDDFLKVMQKRRESCTEFRLQANSPEADIVDVTLEAPPQNDDVRPTTQADELAMTPPSAPSTRNDKELHSTSQGQDTACRQLQY
jgi:hypothetical protein